MPKKQDNVHPTIRALEADVLDAHWRELPLFRASKDKCSVLLFSCFTICWHQHAAGRDDIRVLDHDALRRRLGGLRWCIQWAYARGRTVEEGFDPSFLDVQQALEFGADYEDIADHLKAASIGTESAELLPDGKSVKFSFKNGSNGLQLLNALTAGDEVDVAYENAVSSAIMGNAGQPWRDALNLGFQIISTQTYEAAFRSSHCHTIGLPFVQYEPMRLPGDWDVGGYTLQQAADAWAHIRGFCEICLMAGSQGWDTGIVALTEKSMSASIRSYFGSEGAAALWLSDMTFDPAEKSPNVLVHPLISLRENFVTSPALISSLRSERNITKAIVRRPARSKAWEPIKDRKESVFRNELSRLLGPLGWSVEGPVPIAGGELGNIDAVLTDPGGHVVLAELKWPIAADEIREVYDDEKEFQTGREQVKSAMRWSLDQWGQIRQVCPGAPTEAARTGLSGWVLSRSTVPEFPPTGELGDIPVFTFDMLVAALRDGATSAELVCKAVQKRMDTLPLHCVGSGYMGINVGGTRWWLPASAVLVR